MNLSARTEANLVGVHPDLVRVWVNTPLIPECSRAEVVEGVRTFEKQENYVKTGKSQTLNSRHLTGHAYDFALYRDEDGDGDEDFIKDAFPLYEKQWKLFEQTAKQMGIKLEWGGYWSFADGMHIQASWEQYPIKPNQKTIATSKTIAAATAGIVAAIAEAPVTMFPSIVSTVNSVTDRIPWIGGPWLSWLPTAIAVVAFIFIMNERRKKIQKDGE